MTGNVFVLLAGALSALGFAPLDLWPLTVVALTLLVHSVARAPSLRAASGYGFWFGLGHFLVGLCWIPTAFTYQANMPAWLGWIAEVLLSAYVAVYPMLACGLAWRLGRRHEIAFVLLLAAAWMLVEWLRATLFTGFAWDPLGMIWLTVPGFAPLGSWIGVYGLSALSILVAGALWVGLGRRWPVAAGVAVVLVALLLFVPAPAARVEGSGTPVRIVQPNIGQSEKYSEDERNARLYATLSGKPGPAPRLLLWPEGSTLRFLELEPGSRADLAALLGPGDLLLLGSESVIPGRKASDDIYHNSVFALDSGGKLRWRYDKAHLVPFGEYLPARAILARIGLSRLVPGESDFIPGPGPSSFTLPGFFTAGGAPLTVGVDICYEIVFSGHVIEESHRPSFLFNPSNDAWFGAWGPPQHLAQARMRAIEEGLPVIRATPNGISALVDAHGVVISSLARQRGGAIDGFLPPPLPPTLFSRLGLWVCLYVGLVLAFSGFALLVWQARGLRTSPAL